MRIAIIILLVSSFATAYSQQSRTNEKRIVFSSPEPQSIRVTPEEKGVAADKARTKKKVVFTSPEVQTVKVEDKGAKQLSRHEKIVFTSPEVTVKSTKGKE